MSDTTTKTRAVNPFLVGYVVALMILASLGYLLSDFAIEQQTRKQEQLQKHFVSDVSFVMLPQVSMSIPPANGSASRVRANIGLEVQDKDKTQLEGVAPRITDRLVSYMQKLRAEDIRRMDQEPWLRKQILNEVNAISYPIPVIDIVFRQLVIL